MTVLHEIDRALGRQHRPERVQRWRTIVGNSMWDETSRERLLNRWRRRAGLNDWRGCA